jgi:hypothetical protein
MKLNDKKIITNIVNVVSFGIIAFTGMLIQFNYHLGRNPDDYLVWGMDRAMWHDLHVIFSIIFLIGLIYHFVLNFKVLKFIFFSKGKYLPAYFRFSRVFTIIATLLITTGIVSYLFYLIGNMHTRFHFMEIHDKLGIIIFILFIIHFTQHLNLLMKNIQRLYKSYFMRRTNEN